MNLSQLAKQLKPYIVPWIERALGNVSSAGGSSGTALTSHALDGAYHTGTLTDAQGPQFLLVDGSRNLTGSLTVSASATIDGVDLDVHAADPNAHHDTATAGDGIDVTGQVIAVDVTDFIDTAYGLTESSNNIQINMPSPSGIGRDSTGIYLADAVAGAGLGITAKVLGVGAGNGISVAADAVAVNQGYAFAWTANHTHAGNVTFTGAARTITSNGGYNLTLAADNDLVLDPDNNVVLPNAQELRTVDHEDLVTGITGMRLWDAGGNYRQLILSGIKADELHVRVFTADEVRIDRGEEYWSKSYGIVESDFTIPADEATVDVWFEEAPALGTAKLFTPGDWLLLRTIDWDTGIDIVTVWFEVVDAGANDYVARANQADDRPDRQQWRIRRKVGGTTNFVVKAGSVVLDAGQVGQGWIHLSALNDGPNNGPYLQMGTQTAAGTTTLAPVFTNYVRMGNLNGVGGIGTDLYGFAAAKSLGTSIGSGFEGIVIDPTNGVRLYNADIEFYDGSSKIIDLTALHGFNFLLDNGAWYTNENRYLSWYDNLDALSGSRVTMGGTETGTSLVIAEMRCDGATHTQAQTSLTATKGATAASLSLTSNGTNSYMSVSVYDTITLGAVEHVVINSPYTRVKALRAYDANGIVFDDDAGTQALKVKDGGNLELSAIDSNLIVSDGYYTRHGQDYRYIEYDLATGAGAVLVRLAMASNYKSALVRVVYVERIVSGTERRVADYSTAVLRQGTAGAVYATLVASGGSGSRYIRAETDTVNGYVDFYLTDSTPTDVATGTYNTVFVEIIACTSGSSSTGFTVTFDP